MRRLLQTGLAVLVLGTRASGAPVAEIPFRLTDGLMRIEVRAKGSDSPLSFLLDSGAAVSVLNTRTASRLGLHSGRTVLVKGLGTTTSGRWPQSLSASASGTPLPSRYLVVDLAYLEQSCATPIDGLIGAEFFEGRVVELDFRAGHLRLTTPATGRAKVETLLENFPLHHQRGVWIVEATVGGVPGQKLRLDTGCATAIHWVNGSASPSMDMRHSVGLAPFTAGTARLPLSVGRRSFDSVPATLHQQRIFAGEDGLLGTQFLSRFDAVIIDGRSERLYLGSLAAN